MNILYIAHEPHLGGASRSLLGLIDEMEKKGHRIYALAAFREGALVEELNARNITIIYKKIYWWMGKDTFSDKVKQVLRNVSNVKAAKELGEVIGKYQIDMIHSNSGVINIGALLKRMYKIPHVWHIREFGEEDHGITVHMSRDRAMRFLNEGSDKIVVISKSLYQKYEAHIEQDRLELVYNGVSSIYLQEKTHSNKSTTNLLISGALHEGKGQEEAIRAMGVLIEKGYRNVILNIAGRGEAPFTEKLVRLIETNRLQDHVKLLGYINDTISLRKEMDIELVCSRSEAFGRVTVEAMMSMNPVIASNTGANPELIKDGHNGLLYQQGDHEDLAVKIQMLLDQPNLIEEYGKTGYRIAKEKFTAESNANHIEKIYKEILNKK